MPSDSQARKKVLQKSDNDVVICSAVRTAVTRAKKGGFKDCLPEDLLTAVFKATLDRSKIDPKVIEDIAVGNVLPPGGGANVARAAQFKAGIPHTAGLVTVNRQCSSSLQAVAQIANAISTGQINIGIGAGVEHMTAHYGAGVFPDKVSDDVFSNQEAQDIMIPMGITSENVAKEFGIGREEQDRFAAKSFDKASAAQKAGKFKSEIVPVKVNQIDAKSGESKTAVVDQDDGIRAGVTFESLSKLKPAFSKDGSTHAGNASQVSDGAAAVLLVRRSVAVQLGLPILGKFVTAAYAGVPPKIMGIGPAVAIPKVLKLAGGLAVEDVDFWEINEAFASQAVYSIKKLGIDFEKVNLNGGAIAIGHPLGATGARQVATGMAIGKQTGGKIFACSMCVGGGQGFAALFVNEQ